MAKGIKYKLSADGESLKEAKPHAVILRRGKRFAIATLTQQQMAELADTQYVELVE